ncbi:cupin-like domain-containing protein [Photorhabdus caribbeanensis]|uniref:cupin-like domain-containing protein n=1 Tax=Photorhabdus caribbeanensis TaxID=1004165 RepID=UPI001BD3D9E6|nr:cupin-like domain-containing protein [Photorhabdus caribbeanensis]MBS9425038.1 hypothetical protein [Photorhabdus caribbeanensis]
MNIENPNIIDINSITRDKFEDIYFNQTLPVQFSGMNMDMEIYKKWSFDFFKEKGREILCQVSDDLNDPANITRKIPISDYIEIIQKGEDCPYMTGWSYQKTLPELDNDFILPNWHPEDFINKLPKHMQFRRRWIFFGKKGINCDLHIDCFSTSAWILMVKGIKIFRAISPSSRHNIKMGDSLFDDKIIKRLHKKQIRILEFILKPGTILYIPTGWVHEIHNAEDNIMVTGGFTAKQHSIRFFHNYQSYISKDTYSSEIAFKNYINDIYHPEIVISKEVKNSIEEDLEFTKKHISLLNEKMELYNKMLNKNID